MRPFRSRLAASEWLSKHAHGTSVTVLVRDEAKNTLTAVLYVGCRMHGHTLWFSGVKDKILSSGPVSTTRINRADQLH